MTLFPFFQDIEGKRFLIVGGGRTAARKLRVLRQFTRNTRESPLLYRRWDESGNCFETRS